MRTIEKIAKVDEEGIVTIDTGRQFQNKEVRVIILIEDDLEEDATWYKNALNREAFDFLNSDTENIYST